MSLLIRVAQTSFGALKLNEARLYHCLSQCDFINVKASHDSKFEGKAVCFGSSVQNPTHMISSQTVMPSCPLLQNDIVRHWNQCYVWRLAV